MWIKRITDELSKLNIINKLNKKTLLCDNQAAIDFLQSPIERRAQTYIQSQKRIEAYY